MGLLGRTMHCGRVPPLSLLSLPGQRALLLLMSDQSAVT